MSRVRRVLWWARIILNIGTLTFLHHHLEALIHFSPTVEWVAKWHSLLAVERPPLHGSDLWAALSSQYWSEGWAGSNSGVQSAGPHSTAVVSESYPSDHPDQ